MIDNIFVFVLRVASSPIFAQGLAAPSEPPKIIELVERVEALVTKILPVGALLAVGMVVYGGYLWMTSGGQPDKKQNAQSTLTWSMVGLAFLFLIKMLLTWIVGLVAP